MAMPNYFDIVIVGAGVGGGAIGTGWRAKGFPY